MKQNWESEKEVCLENLRKELLEKHQSELENLQSQWKRGLAEQKAELENTLQARNQAECEYLIKTSKLAEAVFPVNTRMSGV